MEEQKNESLTETITEKCLKLPICTCGKCIIKRRKDDHFSSMPYSSNLSSMYQNDFKWKNPRVFQAEYLKANHSAMENALRQNISGCLLSTAKLSYKPFKVSNEGLQPKKTAGKISSILWIYNLREYPI